MTKQDMRIVDANLMLLCWRRYCARCQYAKVTPTAEGCVEYVNELRTYIGLDPL